LAHRFLLVDLDVVTEGEERILLEYLDKVFARKRYMKGHWDSVITKYKETELQSKGSVEQSAEVREILRRLSQRVLDDSGVAALLPAPHAIDLDVDGFISPHVDSVKFSGGLIAGLSLRSTRVMRLSPMTEHDDVAMRYNSFFTSRQQSPLRNHRQDNGIIFIPPDKPTFIDVELPPRSLYMLMGPLRYLYTHAILRGQDKRCSIMFRDEHQNIL